MKWLLKKCLLLLLFFAADAVVAADKISFNRSIRPILSDKCFACHGPSHHRKADLRLDSFQGATDRTRKGGPAILPGKPDSSLLIERVYSTDPDEVMPPPDSHKLLSRSEKELLKRWIASGAKYEKHWSLTPLRHGHSGKTIDRFVSDHLSKAGLKSKPEADKRTLIRRLCLDLTGLPPTVEQIKRFLNDESDDAYARLVDRLLASPRYGEHMAHYWLDLVRYGDTHGLHGDNYREMFAYRDWVIRAFNRNQPFDRFAVDQIAGDLHRKPTRDQLIASGYNRLHISNSAGSALKEELYVNNVRDRVDTFGTVFLGLSLNCASCHDHKFDPISQKEYYQLFAFFNNIDGPPDNGGKKNHPPFLKLSKNTTTMIMKERKQPRPAYVLIRGEYQNRGERVGRRTPAALPAMKARLPRNRMGLAQWLFDRNHPLTARVAVNRFWQQLFGVGLVKTSEDFGSQGEWPSHPKLLDFLASEFIQSGWDVKSLLRMIVLSKTYRQSSTAPAEEYKRDPDNRLLARGPRFRLDAEVLRDQALYVAGQLNLTMYGKSRKIPQPPGLWQSVALGGSNTGKFVPDQGADILRRSVYSFWKRAYPPPSMTLFNAPNREVCVSRRERTNTPLQALVLMNETQYFTAAKELAKLTLAGNHEDPKRIAWAYERITSHLPDKQEQAALLASLQKLRRHYPNNEQAAWTLLINGLLNLDIVKTKG